MTAADLRRRAADLEEQLQRVTVEAMHLLEHAQREQANVAEALAQNDTIAAHLAEHRLARIERMFHRAQLVLIHANDDRFHAAQAVLGVFAEADHAGTWHQPVPPVTLGAAKKAVA